MENQVPRELVSLLNEIPELNTAYAIDMMGGSYTLYEEALKQSILLIPSHIAQMERHLAESGGLSAFAQKAHGVKGSLRQIGCVHLSSAAEALEKAAKSEDIAYCEAQFPLFKTELTRFGKQVTEALHKSGQGEAPPSRQNYAGSIIDFYCRIARAGQAAENFDSIAASDILAPLKSFRFGGNIDDLLANVWEKLSVFQPLEALPYIGLILKECEKIAVWPSIDD